MLMTGEEKLDKILYRIILNSGKNLLLQFISNHVLTCHFTLLFCVGRYSQLIDSCTVDYILSHTCIQLLLYREREIRYSEGEFCALSRETFLKSPKTFSALKSCL